MAASSQSDVCEKHTETEIDTAMETDEGLRSENGDETEQKDASNNGQEAEDPFKKPAIFAAPSLASKRGAAPSKTATEPDGEKEKDQTEGQDGGFSAPSPADENKTTDKRREGGEQDDKEKVVAAVKPRQDAKPRVLPARGPPAGKFPPLPYTEPPWGGVAPETSYGLEILKNGTIVDTVPLTHKSYFVVGRLPVCDVSLEHPSISRYHAVIQYRGRPGGEAGEERGFYIHDLGSTHGTVVNKNKMPPKTYIRLRVGHVMKFGGSTRLFILQGPESDEEEESELTVTELKEHARKQRAELERRMMGEGSDDDEEEEKDGESGNEKSQGKMSSEDSGCSWGMAEEAAPEENEDEENPFATEFHEDQEAAYLKDPKKALQGFYDREGEELEFEYEDKNHGTWLCRIKLPVDDAMGRQLVAEVTHTGKKKEAAVQCCLEACRILEARGLLRQEAVSRKRKKKNWEDEDYYDSDDDTFLDRTGAVERKRQERMKKAGKIEERPDTYESLVAKLAEVEKQLAENQKKLSAGGKDSSSSSTEDPLDAFMSAVRTEAAMDAVERRKLHVHVADLRKEAQRIRKLVELTRPAQMPSLQPRCDSGTADPQKPKKALPLFGAMKGGSKFKLKTGTIGKLPPKRPNLPAELFDMKELPPGGEEEEEEEEEGEVEEAETHKDNDHKESAGSAESNAELQECSTSQRQRAQPAQIHKSTEQRAKQSREEESAPHHSTKRAPAPSSPESKAGEEEEPAANPSPKRSGKKKVIGPSRPPVPLSAQYPEDDPDYCVWVPPSGQTGDGRTHLNDKYGY
ncbi:kanadaptin isoform X2 [Myripristis murdjan]|uniref:kanadaptin isoform X2 n=1 Tax=Myripristis murdjan TaxID=586833 RepID=UPI001175E930|nr:kanadaptin isoform X2 [Myripristis murdjan]